MSFIKILSVTALSLVGCSLRAQTANPVPYLLKNGAYRLADRQQLQPVAPSTFERIAPFSDGLSLVEKDGQHWFIRADGEKAFNRSVTEASSFRDRYAIAFEPAGNYLITLNGEATLVPYRLNESGIGEGLCVANDKASGKAGFIGLEDGKLRIGTSYEFAKAFSEGLAAVLQNGAWGFIDKTGKTALPGPYEGAMSFHEQLAGVRKGGKWGFINKSGAVVIPFRYDQVMDFSEGYACVQQGGKWSLIDAAGQQQLTLPYQVATWFSEGLAAVMTESGRWGYIDKRGHMVIAPKYLRAASFRDGIALVTDQGRAFYINDKGVEFREP